MSYIDEFLSKKEDDGLPIRFDPVYRALVPYFIFFKNLQAPIYSLSKSHYHTCVHRKRRSINIGADIDRANERMIVYKGTMTMIKHCTIVSTGHRRTDAKVHRCTGEKLTIKKIKV